jgi:hypothetical protein
MWTAETVLVCALTLLHRRVDSFPPIELVDDRPPYVSAAAEAYVLTGDARIYLLTVSPTFTRARRALDKCGELNAIRKIASILVHEEWHVRHGDDESSAYTAQLITLIRLGAGPGTPLYNEVHQSMRAATRKRR